MGDAFSDSDPDSYRMEQEFIRKQYDEKARRDAWLCKFWPNVPINYTGKHKSMYLVPLTTGDTILCHQYTKDCFVLRVYDSTDEYYQERESILENVRMEKLRQSALAKLTDDEKKALGIAS